MEKMGKFQRPSMADFLSADDAVIKVAALVEAGKFAQASALGDESMAMFPNDWRLYQQKARALNGELTSGEGGQDLSKILDCARYYFKAGELAYESGIDSAKAPSMVALARKYINDADFNAAHFLSTTLLQKKHYEHSRSLLVVLSTLPKSASAYLLVSLMNGLNLMPERVSLRATDSNQNINELLDIQRLRDCISSGGFIIHGHFYPENNHNVRAINLLDKILVHVRDPRQTILSWAHYLTGPEFANNDKNLADALSGCSLEERIDWTLENVLPRQVSYLEGWMCSVTQQRLKPEVKFLKQENLAAKPDEYFRSILGFLEIEESMFVPPPPPEVGKLHYRRGIGDEWREVFSATQFNMVQDAITDELLAFYDWER